MTTAIIGSDIQTILLNPHKANTTMGENIESQELALRRLFTGKP